MPDLPEALDRYQKPLPYEVLGVAPDASARDVLNSRNALKRDLQEAGGDPSERARKLQRIEEAYDQVCKPANRMRIDFFLLDPKVGLRQCQALAQGLTRPNTDIQGVIKPRNIRVTHAALLDELATFFREPPKVIGLHVRPMDVQERATLPEPLAIQFDC
jgi:hypothetical protein